jgi:hypothetical protein
MDRVRRWAVLVLALSAVTAGCTSSDQPSTTPSTTPSTVTDTFSGTLNQNGGASYPFTVTAAGNATATLLTVGDPQPKIGVSMGTWNGTSCQIVIANDAAVVGTPVIGTASGAGSLCVRVYDVGNVVTPVTYQVQVVHF